MWKMAIDALGFENDPIVAYEAITNFLNNHNDIEFVLIGNRHLYERLQNQNLNHITFLETEEYVKMDDDVNVIRKHHHLSIQIACDLLKNKQVDALFSACNTSVFVASTFIKLGTLPNVNKFAFLTTIPTIYKNQNIWLLDSGANKEVSGLDLYQFAIMAQIYVTQTTNLNNPRVGLINIGTEIHKGFNEHKEANALLIKNQKINYVGYVETKNLCNQKDCDIYVCNGYTGNIVLKTLEGTMKAVGEFLKGEYHHWYNAFAYWTNKHIINKFKNHFDYKTKAGAFLLGLSAPVIKGHGSSDAIQIHSCIQMMYDALKNQVFQKINLAIEKEFHEENEITVK